MIALLVAACSSQEPQRGKGTALSGGTQSNGTVGFEHVKAGDIFWFALPVPANTSDEPIEITGASVVEVPKGIKVLRYGAYSLDDTEGLALLTEEGDKYTPAFGRLKDHAKEGVKVAAHSSSDIYYLARLKITGEPTRSVRYCKFDYRQGGRELTQTLDCEVELTSK
ncbi:hypothetical protein ACFS5L_25140 [Streptomyces phyllanthi]|uniref:Uncharacterized protein n=1 Tax=Streptomyces phyllanthi TaxID=1803180 RepID=A0A5N8VZS4_9ACTN|nr:hypothetical protein [Streptomyces phyllanthi]MPY39548.1 hypothetical protein [Streptomyces phyllanthi]